MPPDFPQLVLNGVAVGSIIALCAMGLTLTYGILRLANFAHGDFLTLGAYLTLLANQAGLNMFLATVLGAVGTIGVALGANQVFWAPLRERRATSTSLMILSIGLALFLRYTLVLIWGGADHQYRVPVLPALALGGLEIPLANLVIIGVTLGAVVLLHYLLHNTRIGKAMRAVADNTDLARIAGVNVELVVTWTWIVAAGMVAVGGSLYGLAEVVRPNMGWFLVLPMFAAVILGGIGNPYGALVGALVIGVVQEASTPWLGTDYKQGVALVVMILVLLVRPKGLFRSTI